MPRQLKNLKVNYIALVQRPANNKSMVLKSNHHPFILKKTDDDLQRAYGIVYSPDEEDLQGDMASAETIRQAANQFMRDGLQKNIDIEHSFQPVDNTYLAESWLIRKDDPLFPLEKEGAWAVGIQIDDPTIWQQFKNGQYSGISLAGSAEIEQVGKTQDTTTPPSWFSTWMHGFRPDKKTQNNNPEDLWKKMTEYMDQKLAKHQTQDTSTTIEPPDKSAEDLWQKMTKYIDDSLAKHLKKGSTQSAISNNATQQGDSYI